MPVSLRYVIQRLFLTLVVILGVVTIVFIATRIIPAHPEFLWTGPHATEEQLKRAREELHLDEPIVIQYMYYLKSLLQGDLGVSWRTKNPVSADIASALPGTLELAIAGFMIGIALGLPLGLLAALNYGGFIDKIVRMVTVSGSALPVFWAALIFQLILTIKLGLLPGGYRIDPNLIVTTGFKPITGFYVLDTLLTGRLDLFIDVIKHLIMPSLVVAIYPMSLTARMVRSLALESLQEDFVRNLRSWGVPNSIIIKNYILKTIIPPLVASLGLSFGYTLVGAFLVEVIFAWNGLGMYIVMSIMSYDYPAIIGGVMVVAIFYSLINTLVDMLRAHIDPRVRL
ncbi:MAG TPA: ABC transporter permease [Sulfolobales archaeon]|nr:ABC transporter permease [Sulfolobales archaeon]